MLQAKEYGGSGSRLIGRMNPIACVWQRCWIACSRIICKTQWLPTAQVPAPPPPGLSTCLYPGSPDFTCHIRELALMVASHDNERCVCPIFSPGRQLWVKSPVAALSRSAPPLAPRYKNVQTTEMVSRGKVLGFWPKSSITKLKNTVCNW